jgi:hypothetical protein
MLEEYEYYVLYRNDYGYEDGLIIYATSIREALNRAEADISGTIIAIELQPD